MKTVIVKIKDLIGRDDVDGLKVDIRSRINGKLMYKHQSKDTINGKPPIVRLKKVYWKYEKRHATDTKPTQWLYWEWYTDDLPVCRWLTCNFSGIADPEEIENIQLRVVDRKFSSCTK